MGLFAFVEGNLVPSFLHVGRFGLGKQGFLEDYLEQRSPEVSL